MRSIHAGLAILWLGLAAVAPAESLPPEDIPIQCARICGPVVELTSQCSPRRVIRRSGPDQESVAGESYVHVGAPQRRHRRRGEDVDGHLEKRVLVIVAVPNGPGPGPPVTISRTKTGQTDQPAPTSSLPPSRTSILSPILTSEPTRASSQTSTQPTRATPQTSTPQSVRTLSTLDSPSLSALAPSKTRGTTPADDGVQLGTAVNSSPLGAEEECVCSNQSFNVSEVAALCSSCIMQSGDDMNNVEIIMSICNFSPVSYVDGNESNVQNIRVSATRPTVVGSASRATQAASLGAASRTLYLVTAMVTLVWAFWP
ncbi:hypothetical protein G6O67_004281 [Ophiocordyceps sinensis]|uniref:Uncharacterized protein n=1 Tax=Ophiocordyceps sinensis TaxID=72228 RepID=A0A8H4PPF8_9HYPO|nr:hypothetical protein G6O67_004281 [Ophiocordyceps sinensis]